MDLREKIANVLIEMASEGYEEAYPLADAILELPEIKEALAICGLWTDAGYKTKDGKFLKMTPDGAAFGSADGRNWLQLEMGD
jgi:hypothetical protein